MTNHSYTISVPDADSIPEYELFFETNNSELFAQVEHLCRQLENRLGEDEPRFEMVFPKIEKEKAVKMAKAFNETKEVCPYDHECEDCWFALKGLPFDAPDFIVECGLGVVK